MINKELNLKKIKDILQDKGLSVNAFAKQLNMTNVGLRKIIRENTTTGTTLKRIAKLLDVPVSTFTQEVGLIKDNHGMVGQLNAGEVNIHHDEGKDLILKEKDKEVKKMFEALLEELHGFHAISKRRDDYVAKQDEYISSIVKHSYLRNEENMKRIDRLFEHQTDLFNQQKDLIQQQNALIHLVDRQNQKVEERADRLLDILEKKL